MHEHGSMGDRAGSRADSIDPGHRPARRSRHPSRSGRGAEAAARRSWRGAGEFGLPRCLGSEEGPRHQPIAVRLRVRWRWNRGPRFPPLEALDVSGASRAVVFPGRSYGWYPDRPAYLPEGKSWILDTEKNELYLECGKIRLSDPATLRHVLSTTTAKRPAGVYDGTRTTLHEGSTTIGKLYKLNPRLWVGDFEKPTGRYASYTKLPVKWRLWLGPDQLVRRCQTRYDEPEYPWNVEDRSLTTADVRFSGWGDAIHIEPPPAEEVATRDELVFPDHD
ncbi:hypothetical protein ACFSTC_36585 [Nonomuraea ferruginea]